MRVWRCAAGVGVGVGVGREPCGSLDAMEDEDEQEQGENSGAVKVLVGLFVVFGSGPVLSTYYLVSSVCLSVVCHYRRCPGASSSSFFQFILCIPIVSYYLFYFIPVTARPPPAGAPRQPRFELELEQGQNGSRGDSIHVEACRLLSHSESGVSAAPIWLIGLELPYVPSATCLLRKSNQDVVSMDLFCDMRDHQGPNTKHRS